MGVGVGWVWVLLIVDFFFFVGFLFASVGFFFSHQKE